MRVRTTTVTKTDLLENDVTLQPLHDKDRSGEETGQETGAEETRLHLCRRREDASLLLHRERRDRETENVVIQRREVHQETNPKAQSELEERKERKPSTKALPARAQDENQIARTTRKTKISIVVTEKSNDQDRNGVDPIVDLM